MRRSSTGSLRDPLPSLLRAAALPALLLLAGGCSREGSVRVVNSSGESITVNIHQGPDQEIPAGETLSEPIKISKGLLPPSEREVEVRGRGVVVNPFSVRVVVGEGEEPSIDVPANAAALVIVNKLECTLQNLNIRACGVGQWGANVLDAPLRPEGVRSMRLEPGCYDAKLTSLPCPADPFSRTFLGRSLQVGVPDTIFFRLTGG